MQWPHATIEEPSVAVFSVQSMLRLYDKVQLSIVVVVVVVAESSLVSHSVENCCSCGMGTVQQSGR
jgi:hypothetical protein